MNMRHTNKDKTLTKLVVKCTALTAVTRITTNSSIGHTMHNRQHDVNYQMIMMT